MEWEQQLLAQPSPPPETSSPPQGVAQKPTPNSNKFKIPANGLKKVLDPLPPAGQGSGAVEGHPAVQDWLKTNQGAGFAKTYLKPHYQDALKAHLGNEGYDKLFEHLPYEHMKNLHQHAQSPAPKNNKFTQPASALKKVLDSPHTETSHVSDWLDKHPQFQKTYMAPKYQDALKGHLGDKAYNELQEHLKAAQGGTQGQQSPSEKKPTKKWVGEGPEPGTESELHPALQELADLTGTTWGDSWKGKDSQTTKEQLQNWQDTFKQGQPETAQAIQQVLDKHFGDQGEIKPPENHQGLGDKLNQLYVDNGKPNYISNEALDAWNNKHSQEKMLNEILPNLKGNDPQLGDKLQRLFDEHYADQDEIDTIKSQQPQKSFGHAVQEAFPDVFKDHQVEAVNQKTPDEQKSMLQKTIDSPKHADKPEVWDKLNKIHNDFFGEDAYNTPAAKKELAQQMAKYHGTDPGEYKEWLDTLDNDDLKDLKDNPAKAGYAHSDYMNGQDYDVDYDPEYDPDNDEYEGAEDEPEDDEVEDHPGFDPHGFVNDYKKAFPDTTWGHKELGGDPENAKNILQGIIDEPEEEGLGDKDDRDQYANPDEYDEHYDQWMADKLKAQQLYDKHFGDGGHEQSVDPNKPSLEWAKLHWPSAYKKQHHGDDAMFQQAIDDGDYDYAWNNDTFGDKEDYTGVGNQPEERQPQSLGQKMQAIDPNINAEVFDKQSPEGQKDLLQNALAKGFGKNPHLAPQFQKLYDDHYGDIDEINNIKGQQHTDQQQPTKTPTNPWQNSADQHQSLAQGINTIFPNNKLDLDNMSVDELKQQLEQWQEHLADTPGHADNVAKLKALYDQSFGDGDIDAIKSQMPAQSEGPNLDAMSEEIASLGGSLASLAHQIQNSSPGVAKLLLQQQITKTKGTSVGQYLQDIYDDHFGQGAGHPLPGQSDLDAEIKALKPGWIKGDWFKNMSPEQQQDALQNWISKAQANPGNYGLSTEEGKQFQELHDKHFGQHPSSQQYTGAEPMSAEEMTKGVDWGDQPQGPSWQDIQDITGLSSTGVSSKAWNKPGADKAAVLQQMIKTYGYGSDTANALQELYDQHFGDQKQDHPHAGTDPHAYPGASFADVNPSQFGSYPGILVDEDSYPDWKLNPGVAAFLESQGYGPTEFGNLPSSSKFDVSNKWSDLDPGVQLDFAAMEHEGDQDEINQIKQQMPDSSQPSPAMQKFIDKSKKWAPQNQKLIQTPQFQKWFDSLPATGGVGYGDDSSQDQHPAGLLGAFKKVDPDWPTYEPGQQQKPSFDLQSNGVPTAQQLEAWGLPSNVAIGVSGQSPEKFKQIWDHVKKSPAGYEDEPWGKIYDALKDHDWPLQGGGQQKIMPDNFDAQKYAEDFGGIHGIAPDVVAGSGPTGGVKVKNMTYDQAKKDLKYNMDYDGWSDPGTKEKHQALWDKYFGDGQQDGSSSPVIDKTQTPNKKELMDAGLGNYMADGLSKKSPEDFWKDYEDMKGHASPGSAWDAVHKHFEGQSSAAPDTQGGTPTQEITPELVTQKLQEAPNSGWKPSSEEAYSELEGKSPEEMKKILQDYVKFDPKTHHEAQWVLDQLWGGQGKQKQPEPSGPSQFDPQAFAEQYKEILPGSSSSLATGTVTPEKAQEKLKELIEGNPGTAKTQKLQELHDQWFGSTPAGGATKKTPTKALSPHYKALMDRVNKAPTGAFSDADMKKFRSKKFQTWFDKAPPGYRETLKTNPGIVIEDFDNKSYGSPVGGGEWGDQSPGKDKYYDVMGYPKTKKDYELPQYLRQNDPRSEKVKFPQYEDEQETLPLSPGEKLAPHYGPLPIYRVMSLDLDHKVDSSRAPSSLKTDKERKLWAQQQNSRLQRIDTILNGDKARRTPEQTMQGLKSWGSQYGLTDKEVNDVAATLMGQQGDLFADDKWNPIKELSAKHPEIDMSEFHDLANKLDITTPTESKGNYDHPELGKLILDYLENTKHRSSEGGKGSEGGLGWHWTRAVNKAYKGIPAADMGKEKMRATDRKVPVAISGLWSGQGEGEGHGGAYDPFDPNSRELEHNLYSHAPVHVRRLQIRAPSAENQGYGTWHDTIDHGPMSTWTPGRYEEGDEFSNPEYAPGERVDYKPSLAKELTKVVGTSHDAEIFDKLKPGHKADMLLGKIWKDNPDKRKRIEELYRDFFVGRPDLPIKPHERRASLQRVADHPPPVVPIDCGDGYSYNWQTDECESGVCPEGSYFDPEHDICTPYPQSACPPGYLYNEEHGVCEIIPDNRIEDAQEVTARKRGGNSHHPRATELMAAVIASINYFWGTLVLPRVGNATHIADAYAWGGSFSSTNVNQGTDCSGAVSAELSALVRGAAMIYARQFWTGSFAGITPGQIGPFFGCADTTNLVCIAQPTDAPADASMIIAIIQTGPDPALAAQAHMICRVPDFTQPGTDIKVTGIDIEMGGESNDYHTSQTDSTCASVMDTTEFNQFFYLPSLDTSNSSSQDTQEVGVVVGGGEQVAALYYPDVSNNNWSSNTDVTNFLSQLIPQGFAGAAHKVSEGNYYADSYWPVFQSYCQANNIPYIGYHCLTTDDAASQVATYQSNNGSPNVMIDHEQFNGQNADIDQFWAVVNAFNAANINVQLEYLPQWFWEDIGEPDLSNLASENILLVSSAYPAGGGYASTVYTNAGGNSGEGWASYGGATPSAWQFTDQATVGGFTVDCNVYLGTDITVLFGTAPAVVTTPPPVTTTPPSPPPPLAYPYPWVLPTDDSINAAAAVAVSQFLGV